MSNKFDLIKKPLKRPQKKFHKLKNLKCFNEVDRRVKNGYPLSDIARYIQEERGEYKEAKSTSVVGLLNEYRNSLSAADVVSNNMPSTFLESEKKLKKTLNELEELEKLYFEHQSAKRNWYSNAFKVINLSSRVVSKDFRQECFIKDGFRYDSKEFR
jgi:predicted RNase H-like nuclease (RuvC/YqgF family)